MITEVESASSFLRANCLLTHWIATCGSRACLRSAVPIVFLDRWVWHFPGRAHFLISWSEPNHHKDEDTDSLRALHSHRSLLQKLPWVLLESLVLVLMHFYKKNMHTSAAPCLESISYHVLQLCQMNTSTNYCYLKRHRKTSQKTGFQVGDSCKILLTTALSFFPWVIDSSSVKWICSNVTGEASRRRISGHQPKLKSSTHWSATQP